MKLQKKRPPPTVKTTLSITSDGSTNGRKLSYRSFIEVILKEIHVTGVSTILKRLLYFTRPKASMKKNEGVGEDCNKVICDRQNSLCSAAPVIAASNKWLGAYYESKKEEAAGTSDPATEPNQRDISNMTADEYVKYMDTKFPGYAAQVHLQRYKDQLFKRPLSEMTEVQRVEYLMRLDPNMEALMDEIALLVVRPWIDEAYEGQGPGDLKIEDWVNAVGKEIAEEQFLKQNTGTRTSPEDNSEDWTDGWWVDQRRSHGA